jgi:outer membrane protein assembly factor BamD
MDHLAGKEMTIGRFYMAQTEYIAGISRFRKVVKDFQTTSQVPEALHRLVECYLAVGLNLEAQKATAVLGYNFPDSKWFQYSYDLLEGKGLEPVDLPEDKGPHGGAGNFFEWLF